MKKIIRLTESDLHNIVRQCVNEAMSYANDEVMVKVYIEEMVKDDDDDICQKVADVLQPILHEGDYPYPCDNYILVPCEADGPDEEVGYGGGFRFDTDEAVNLIQNSDLDDDLKDTCISNLRDEDLMFSSYLKELEKRDAQYPDYESHAYDLYKDKMLEDEYNK